jgi:hypothetical protein
MTASHRMGRYFAAAALVCAGALVMACSTGGQGSGATASPGAGSAGKSSASTSTSSRDALTGEEMLNTAATNVYDALHTLRPEMLTGHGLGAPDVYIRDLREPKGVERLREIPVAQVQQVQYVKPENARNLSGQQSQGGALVVTMR